MTENKIKVLVTEDSIVTRTFLVKMLSADPDIEVIGTADNGAEALEFIRKTKPDVITMDINMPVMGGFEATAKIMNEKPVPIVIVSSAYTPSETAKKFKALEAGAVAILPLPFGREHPDFENSQRHFLNTVKIMSEVKLIRRWDRPASLYKQESDKATALTYDTYREVRRDFSIIAIGASAGGPVATKEILDNLSADLSVPVIIVQHIDSEFAQGYADWLNLTSHLKVVIAKDGEKMKPGHAYMASGDHQIGVGCLNTIMLCMDPPESGLRPSVSFLFRSVLNVYRQKAIGILLSGMGVDGAKELKSLKDAGSVTIAQDASSSLIHGMPGEAIRQQGACYILTPAQIVTFIQKLIPNLSK
ncbi:MAG: chemotaxis-specific protein-glutamate methyltransferase CheB [Bacteroidota bacterium]|nr:chemotaxis-specific protein-glutamate methyltransferase CheB [Bacteroidota bacterium]